jgi:hypothetical protein
MENVHTELDTYLTSMFDAEPEQPLNMPTLPCKYAITIIIIIIIMSTLYYKDRLMKLSLVLCFIYTIT